MAASVAILEEMLVALVESEDHDPESLPPSLYTSLCAAPTALRFVKEL